MVDLSSHLLVVDQNSLICQQTCEVCVPEHQFFQHNSSCAAWRLTLWLLVLLCLQDVPRCVLQLLAIGCVLLASKELEVWPALKCMCPHWSSSSEPSLLQLQLLCKRL